MSQHLTSVRHACARALLFATSSLVTELLFLLLVSKFHCQQLVVLTSVIPHDTKQSASPTRLQHPAACLAHRQCSVMPAFFIQGNRTGTFRTNSPSKLLNSTASMIIIPF